MRPAENIKRLIKNAKIKINPKVKSAALEELINELEKSKQSKPTSRPDIWRIIMKKPITKLAAAAVLVVAVLLSITFLDQSATPAYAIEDTIRALEEMHIDAIKMSGIGFGKGDNDQETEYEYTMWAKPNEDRTRSKEARFEMSDQIIIVTQSGVTYRYHPWRNVVYIKEFGDFKIDPWLNGKFFSTFKKIAKNWQITYGKDEQTDRDSIFATCVHPYDDKSWWIEFDSQTRLPVKLKQWKNADFQGKPQLYFTDIQYNPELPEGIFEFEIPEGAKVIRESPKMPAYFEDPNCGIAVDGLTDEEASLQIVEDYLQALIDGNWKYLAQLRPICNPEQWELKFKHSDSWPQKIIVIDAPYVSDRCNIGPVVPCTIEYSDGQIRNISLVVKIREIKGQKSCVIAGTFGGQ